MKKITSKKIRRHNRRFFTVYAVLVAVALLAILVGYKEISTHLTEYESVQTRYVADEAFLPFENLDYNTLYHYEAPENQAQTDPASYAQFASGYLSGKSITYRETGNRDTDQGQVKTYTVYADGKRFAKFYLKETGETTEHGYEKWGFDSAEINLLDNAFQGYKIQCYSVNRVFLDGVEIPQSDMTVTGTVPGYEGHLFSGMSAPKTCEYDVPQRLNAPRVTAVNASGAETEVQPDEYGVFRIAMPYQDAELREGREKWIVDTAKVISEYTTGHATMNDIRRRFIENSPAYTAMTKVDTSIIFNHSGYEFKNTRTENYYTFSNDYFAVDVYCDFVVYYYEGTRTYNNAYRFFFRRDGDKWMLYDFAYL